MKIIKYLWKSLLHFFNTSKSKGVIESKQITVSDIQIYDDVYLVLSETVFSAWVMKKTSKILELCYETPEIHEISFDISGLSKETVIINGNNKVILNKINGK